MTYEYSEYLAHHGIKGQKWGVRRFQNEDGTLINPKGRQLIQKKLQEKSEKKKEESPEEAQARRDKAKKILGILGGVAATAAIGYLAYKGSTNLRDSARTLMEQATRQRMEDVYNHQRSWDSTFKGVHDIHVNSLVEEQKKGITRTSALRQKLGMKAKAPRNAKAIEKAEKRVRENASMAERARHSNEKYYAQQANRARNRMKASVNAGQPTDSNDEWRFSKASYQLEDLSARWDRARGRTVGSYESTPINSIIRRRDGHTPWYLKRKYNRT